MAISGLELWFIIACPTMAGGDEPGMPKTGILKRVGGKN
jgi:hypothetical protein